MEEQSLEGKTQAPIILFRDGIDVGGAGMGAIRVVKIEVNLIQGLASFGYKFIEAIYDTKGNPKWQNGDFDKPRKVEVPEHLKGTQVVFTDQTIYEGADFCAHHFSFLRNGKYAGHDHNQGVAFDFGYKTINAIFDRDGKLIWENQDRQPKR